MQAADASVHLTGFDQFVGISTSIEWALLDCNNSANATEVSTPTNGQTKALPAVEDPTTRDCAGKQPYPEGTDWRETNAGQWGPRFMKRRKRATGGYAVTATEAQEAQAGGTS